MATVMTSSLTMVPGQTAASSASLVTSWPACVTRQREDRKGFGGQRDHLGTAPQAFVAEVELKRAKHEALRLWHTSPFPRPPGHGLLGMHQEIFSIFSEIFHNFSSGLWPGQNAKLRSRVKGQHPCTPWPTGV